MCFILSLRVYRYVCSNVISPLDLTTDNLSLFRFSVCLFEVLLCAVSDLSSQQWFLLFICLSKAWYLCLVCESFVVIYSTLSNIQQGIPFFLGYSITKCSITSNWTNSPIIPKICTLRHHTCYFRILKNIIPAIFSWNYWRYYVVGINAKLLRKSFIFTSIRSEALKAHLYTNIFPPYFYRYFKCFNDGTYYLTVYVRDF